MVVHTDDSSADEAQPFSCTPTSSGTLPPPPPPPPPPPTLLPMKLQRNKRPKTTDGRIEDTVPTHSDTTHSAPAMKPDVPKKPKGPFKKLFSKNKK